MEDLNDTPAFSSVLAALLDMDSPFPARYLRNFSDLSRSNLKSLLAVWEDLPDKRKISLLEDLDEVHDKDTLVNFDDLAENLLIDTNPSVRVLALRLLWECEDPALVPPVITLSTNDQDETVRATSAALLGRFVLLGELEMIRSELKELVEDHLISLIAHNEMPRVKQRALESLGYSSHPSVPELIRNAYASGDTDWVASSLCAMGRSADEQWASYVQETLISPIPEIQFEAIRAAGELELTSSRETMLDLLEEDIEDTDTRLALIWALSQIGGDDVKEKLTSLVELASDDEEIDWIEHALENLDLSSSEGLELLDISPYGENDAEYEDEDNPEEDEEFYLEEDDDLDED